MTTTLTCIYPVDGKPCGRTANEVSGLYGTGDPSTSVLVAFQRHLMTDHLGCAETDLIDLLRRSYRMVWRDGTERVEIVTAVQGWDFGRPYRKIEYCLPGGPPWLREDRADDA